jgi:hypothetical protein
MDGSNGARRHGERRAMREEEELIGRDERRHDDRE